MKPSAFRKKWDHAFMEAIQPIMEEVREAGFSVSGPYSLESEGPIWGFVAWKAPTREDDDKAVDVWWRFDPVYDEKPLRYWPALDLIEKSGVGAGTTNFWDDLVDLGDDETVRMILEGLDTETDFIIRHLKEQDWSREGPKEWRPAPPKRKKRR